MPHFSTLPKPTDKKQLHPLTLGTFSAVPGQANLSPLLANTHLLSISFRKTSKQGPKVRERVEPHTHATDLSHAGTKPQKGSFTLAESKIEGEFQRRESLKPGSKRDWKVIQYSLGLTDLQDSVDFKAVLFALPFYPPN